METKLKVFGGGRVNEDIYDKCKKDKAIDINGEVVGNDSWDSVFDGLWYTYGQDDDDNLRLKASLKVREITDDPLEHDIADLMLDYGYTEVEVAEILFIKWKLRNMNESLARVKWFMRKIEAWKQQGRKTARDEDD